MKKMQLQKYIHQLLIYLLTVIMLGTSGCERKQISSIQSLIITPPTASIEVRDTYQFHAVVIYRNGVRQKVTAQAKWVSSDPTVASLGVDHSATAGQATGLKIGETNITVTYDGVTSESANLSVLQNGMKKRFVYMANQGTTTPLTNGIVYCAVNGDDGTLGTCQNATLTFTNPQPVFASELDGIAINSSSTGTYAYISNSSNGNIAVCGINSTTGDFTSCTNYSTGINQEVVSLAFDSASNALYAMVFADNSLHSCPLSDDGSQLTSPCQLTRNTIPKPSGRLTGMQEIINMTINASNTFLYFGQYYGDLGQIGYCQIPQSCKYKGTNIFADNLSAPINPNAVAVHQTEEYAYVSDTSGNLIAQCKINTLTNSFFPNCKKTVSSIGGSVYGMVLNPKNSNLYMTDISKNVVWYCTVGTVPDSPTCQSYNGGSPGLLNVPIGIAITP